ALRPSRRHQQRPAGAPRRRGRDVPLQGLPALGAREGDDAADRGVRQAFLAARPAVRLRAHPPLRPAGQPRAAREVGGVPASAGGGGAERAVAGGGGGGAEAVPGVYRRGDGGGGGPAALAGRRRDHEGGQLVSGAAAARAVGSRRREAAVRAGSEVVRRRRQGGRRREETQGRSRTWPGAVNGQRGQAWRNGQGGACGGAEPGGRIAPARQIETPKGTVR